MRLSLTTFFTLLAFYTLAQQIEYNGTTYSSIITNATKLTYEVRIVRGSQVMYDERLTPGNSASADIVVRPNQRRRTQVKVFYTEKCAENDRRIAAQSKREMMSKTQTIYQNEINNAEQRLTIRAVALAGQQTEYSFLRALGAFTNGVLDIEEAIEDINGVSEWETVGDALDAVSEYAIDEGLAEAVGQAIYKETGLSREASIDGVSYIITYVRQVIGASQRLKRNRNAVNEAFTSFGKQIDKKVSTSLINDMSYSLDQSMPHISYTHTKFSPVFIFEYSPFSLGSEMNTQFQSTPESAASGSLDLENDIEDYEESFITNRNETLRAGLAITPELRVGKGAYFRFMGFATWQRYSYSLKPDINKELILERTWFSDDSADPNGFQTSDPFKVRHRRAAAELRGELTFGKAISIAAFYGKPFFSDTYIDLERSPIITSNVSWAESKIDLLPTQKKAQYGTAFTLSFAKRRMGLTAAMTWFELEHQTLLPNRSMTTPEGSNINFGPSSDQQLYRIDIGLSLRL